MLELALTESGADVWTAVDGPAALASVDDAVPELILLDLAMPGMDGWGVIQALASSPRTARIPVVLETSAQDFVSFDRARREGVAAFISKPFRLAEVIETCRRVLEGARPLQGRSALSEPGPSVQLRDDNDNMITVGHLVDVGATGAQVETEAPVPLAQKVSITYWGENGLVTASGQVRWVTRVGDRFHLGLQLWRE